MSPVFSIPKLLRAALLILKLFTISATCVRAASLPSPSQTVVDQAIGISLISYNRSFPGGAYTNGAWFGGASITLAAASFAGNTSADARLLQQIRHSITGGNEPCANGGYPSEHERHATGMFAIARHIPRIWNQLSATEKTKVDLVMKGAFIATAFTTNDGNPYISAGTQQYSLDGDSNLGRDWNPNYREGMIGGVLVGLTYFGGPAPADAPLNSFNHATYLAELQANGLTNLQATYSWKVNNPSSKAPSAATIEAGVKNYRYKTIPLANYFAIYQSLLDNTFGATVNCGINGGAGINGAGKIVSGCASLPNAGALGMLREFDSSDANGARSSGIYAYDGYRPHLTNQLVLIVGGLWPPVTSQITASMNRVHIGATDLWFKLQQGYIGYAKGASQGTFNMSFSGEWGFTYNKATWFEVLKPFHDAAATETLPAAPTSLNATPL